MLSCINSERKALSYGLKISRGSGDWVGIGSRSSPRIDILELRSLLDKRKGKLPDRVEIYKIAGGKNVYTKRAIDHLVECHRLDRSGSEASQSQPSSRSQSQAPSSGYSVVEH